MFTCHSICTILTFLQIVSYDVHVTCLVKGTVVDGILRVNISMKLVDIFEKTFGQFPAVFVGDRNR